MFKSKYIILILIAVFGVVVLFFVLGGSESSVAQNVTFEASADKVSYSAGEEITLSLNLTNSGTTDVCISERSLGSIRFMSITRDGATLETRSAPSYFITSFSEILKSNLTPVVAGDTMELFLKSSFDPGLGSQALSTTIPDDTSGIATFYNVEKPGTYVLEMVYDYAGESSSDCADILNAPSNTATVTFIIE